jgi:hypothetical protein
VNDLAGKVIFVEKPNVAPCLVICEAIDSLFCEVSDSLFLAIDEWSSFEVIVSDGVKHFLGEHVDLDLYLVYFRDILEPNVRFAHN